MKRSQHIKHKKNFARPQKNAAVKAGKGTTKGKNAGDKALAVSKKVFGKPIGQKSKKRDRGQEKKQLYTSMPAPVSETVVNGTNGDADEMDDEDVQDMLDMLHADDDPRDDSVSNVKNNM